MKTFVRHAVTLLAVTVACQAGLAMAEEYYRMAGNDQTTPMATADKGTVLNQSGCNACGPSACCPEPSCGTDCGCGQIGCEGCSPFGIVGTFGLDAFKGVADDGIANFGVVTGLNTGAMLPGLEDYGLGWQTGISYGVYDLDGRLNDVDPAQSQQQTFVTTGFYRKAKGDSRVSFGLVYDWMYNANWGVAEGVGASNPTMGQWRGQIEYALSECNSLGVWGAWRDLYAVQDIEVTRGVISTTKNRAISQINLFWHHKFNCTGADSWLWMGVPDHSRMDQGVGQGKSLGDWTFGASISVPMSSRLALYANAAYMHPSASAGDSANVDAGYDVGMGIAWYFGGNARSSSLYGKCSTPYMPLANNTNFLVEQYSHIHQ